MIIEPIDIDLSRTMIDRCRLSLLSSLINESGNDGTWLTIFGFRTPTDIRLLIDEFTRSSVIEKHVVR
jgi:hypothetical protein